MKPSYLLLLLGLIGCGTPSAETPEQTEQKPVLQQLIPITQLELPEGFTACPQQRPEVCSQLYRPVQALQQNGEIRQASNSCHACADNNVIGYRPQTEPSY